MDVFKPVFKGRGEIFLPARFRSLEGSVFTASDDLKRPHVMLFFQLVFRTVTMDFPASATLGERLRAYARFRADEAAAPFAESSKQKARWFVQKEAGRVWFFRIRFPAATADGKQNGYGKAIGAGEKEQRFDATFRR